MTSALINHLWQSTVFVLAAALAAFVLRENRAGVRHSVWVAASVKFLVPFSLLVSLGGALPWRTTVAPVAAPIAPAIAAAIEPFGDPIDTPAAAAGQATPAGSTTEWRWPAAASAWTIGLLAVGAIRLRGWRQIRLALRASERVTLAGPDAADLCVHETSSLFEPGVVGIWRPVLLVPAGFAGSLTRDQLRAVVAHEVHHIRRRDNLTSAVHMVVEAVFWFHPAVWWVGARLIDERERACDEHVLAVGASPEAYAEGILSVCRRYVESPVACVAGVTGSDLKKRIASILAARVGARLTIARRALLVAAVLMATGIPIVVGVLTAPLRASSQATTGPLPAFEAVSVRPCDASAPGPGRRGMLAGTSPGRLTWPCDSLLGLIHAAYGAYASGRVNSVTEQPVFPEASDIPEWIWRDRFTIEAKAAGEPSALVMVGPMLQRVLEDRFKLKVHRETRDAPVYELVVAKGGSKLTAFTPGTCVPYDGSVSPQPPLEAGQHRCSNSTRRDSDGNWVAEAEATTLDSWVAGMNIAGRPVVNKTGIAGLVTFRLVTPATATDADEAMSSRISAMKNQLGLELRAGKAARDFLIIDHAEKPDSAGAGAPASSRQAPSADAGAPASSRQGPSGVAAPNSSTQASAAGSAEGSAATQKFDVASIRPCENGPVVPGGRNGGAGPVFSPGLLIINCMTVEQMLFNAYVSNGEALLNDEGRFNGPNAPARQDVPDTDSRRS